MNTDRSEPAGAAIPIGNKVCGNIFDARYEPGTRTNVMAMMLWMNPIYERPQAAKKPEKQKCTPAKIASTM